MFLQAKPQCRQISFGVSCAAAYIRNDFQEPLSVLPGFFKMVL
ncbi:hypothetical protein Ngar_c15040 [Candidatus Nitrososphaera gargensis Ga9.2]|uniref:Uncharacterized protein n=1 Tax=Nitrososphaera gargensis (strain Ga9.2) TaxID=1237085 RepID=K0IMY6_NITGG|nr:hypothetical protein Ngar_c15040 [Candidatus Nitrososphaera gargensis Ga9.2]